VPVAEEIDRRSWVGLNPAGGAAIDYWLKRTPADEVTLEIVDAAGKPVRRYSSKSSRRAEEQAPEWPDQAAAPDRLPVAAGANRFVWDLRYEPPTPLPGAFYQGLAPEGPILPPGRYQVRLTVGGKTSTAPLELRLDPRLAGHDGDVEKSFAIALQVRNELDQLHATVIQLRAVRAQLAELAKRVGDSPSAAGREVLGARAALEKKLAGVEGELVQVKKKSSEGNLRYPSMLDDQYDTLRWTIESDAPPTQAAIATHDLLARRLKEQLARWDEIVNKDVPALNALVKRADIVEIRAR
jgi:hypothetical protein